MGEEVWPLCFYFFVFSVLYVLLSLTLTPPLPSCLTHKKFYRQGWSIFHVFYLDKIFLSTRSELFWAQGVGMLTGRVYRYSVLGDKKHALTAPVTSVL